MVIGERSNSAPPATEPPTRRRPRILFVAEAASLAHVARPFVLASSLDPDAYDIHFAAPPTPSVELVLAGAPFTRWPLKSIPEATFMRRLRRGIPFWTVGEIERYVAIDRQLIRDVQPDLIVGDLRVSLGVSAPLEGVPWAALMNASWSPDAGGWRHPVPQTTLSSPYIPWMTQFGFELLLPLFISWYTRPVNAARARHGLAPFGRTFAAMFAGDDVLYVDPPGLIPFRRPMPPNHRLIGAAIWNAPAPLPPWWDELEGGDPLVYVSLGSSGKLQMLPKIVGALAGLPVRVAVAVGRREAMLDVPPNVFVAPYLPGDLLARRAALVIGNGGSAGLYQALNEGTPVLGVPENLDQHMTMAAVAGHGATLSIRSDRLSRGAIRRSVERMLGDESFRLAAGGLRNLFRAHPASEQFPAFVDARLGLRPNPERAPR
jgi:UDP:flavonoid glycosyltransferase YjiC (YdhE family)